MQASGTKQEEALTPSEAGFSVSGTHLRNLWRQNFTSKWLEMRCLISETGRSRRRSSLNVGQQVTAESKVLSPLQVACSLFSWIEDQDKEDTLHLVCESSTCSVVEGHGRLQVDGGVWNVQKDAGVLSTSFLLKKQQLISKGESSTAP